MTLRQLLRAAEQVARTADTLSLRFARVLADVLRETERRLVPLVQEAAAGKPTAIIRAAQANRTRGQIRQALADAGFDALAATAYGDALDPVVAAVLRGRALADLSADLTPLLGSRLDALKALASLDLLDEGDVAARALWKALTRGIFGSQPVPRILEDLAKVIDRTEPQIRTLYDTSVSVFGRQVEALKAGDDDATRFVFLGPVDEKIRPWCREHVGKVYTRQQIDGLDNGQLNNVFLTGGGYNCRHVWNEVSKYSELYDYAGTDQRVPEVSEDLGALAA